MIPLKTGPFIISFSIWAVDGGHWNETCQRKDAISVALLSTYRSMHTLWVRRRVLRPLKRSNIFDPKCLRRLELKLTYCNEGVCVKRSPSRDSKLLLNKMRICKFRYRMKSFLEMCLKPTFDKLKTVRSGKNWSMFDGIPSKNWLANATALTDESLFPAVWFPVTFLTWIRSPLAWMFPVHV